MLDDWNALAVVPDFDLVVFRVDGDLDAAHVGITDFVVRRVDQNLVEYLVQTGNVRDLSLKRKEDG